MKQLPELGSLHTGINQQGIWLWGGSVFPTRKYLPGTLNWFWSHPKAAFKNKIKFLSRLGKIERVWRGWAELSGEQGFKGINSWRESSVFMLLSAGILSQPLLFPSVPSSWGCAGTKFIPAGAIPWG